MFKNIAIVFLFIFVVQVASGKAPSKTLDKGKCPYTSDEKAQLRRNLCNENSMEYSKTTGPDCFEANLKERFQDTSIQLYSTKLCGFPGYHDQLLLNVNESIPAIQKLGDCAGFNVDVQKLWDSVNEKTTKLIANQKCTSKVRSAIQRQMPRHFEKYKAGKEAMKQSGMEVNSP